MSTQLNGNTSTQLANLVPGFLPADLFKTILVLGRCKEDFINGTKVIFHFKASLTACHEKVIDDSRNMKKPMELLFGKKFKLEIWEAMLKTMGIGEVAEFQVPMKYLINYPMLSKALRDAESGNTMNRHTCCGMLANGCGYHDLDHLIQRPEDMTFIFEILHAEKLGEYVKETWQMSVEEKLASIPDLKETGNEKFKSGDIQGARADYFQAISRLEQLILLEKPGTPEHITLTELKVPLLLNYGFCLMKEGEYYEAIQHFTTVITIDPNNCKGFFRRGKCHHELGNFDEAQQDYFTAGGLDPSLKKSIQEEIRSLTLAKKTKYSEDISIYNKLFA